MSEEENKDVNGNEINIGNFVLTKDGHFGKVSIVVCVEDLVPRYTVDQIGMRPDTYAIYDAQRGVFEGKEAVKINGNEKLKLMGASIWVHDEKHDSRVLVFPAKVLIVEWEIMDRKKKINNMEDKLNKLKDELIELEKAVGDDWITRRMIKYGKDEDNDQNTLVQLPRDGVRVF